MALNDKTRKHNDMDFQKVRALAREDAKTIPIIAMTANAFAEDVQAVKNAGMNDHLAKPLEMNKVIHTIGKYLNK